MRLLWKIAGIYYDAMAAPLTIPGGISGESVSLVVNDSAPSNNSGSYQFKACTTNNQATSFVSVSDFALSAYGWQALNCTGTCGNPCNLGIAATYGSGKWSSVTYGCSNQVFDIIFSPTFDARSIVSVVVEVHAASAIPTDGFGSGIFAHYTDGTGEHGIFPSTSLAAGNNTITLPINASNVTRLRVTANSQSTTVATYITKVTINGIGSKPSQLP